jgi:hypothetical protein
MAEIGDRVTRENFAEVAHKFLKATKAQREGKLPVITLKSPNFTVWREYFQRHLGFTPLILKWLLIEEREEMTVVTEWPHQFDPEFVSDPNWRVPVSTIPLRHERETGAQLRARYGENWGIRNPDKKRERTPEQIKADLYARYGREKVDAVPDAAPGAWQKLGRDFRLEPTPARELPEDQMPPVPF